MKKLLALLCSLFVFSGCNKENENDRCTYNNRNASITDFEPALIQSDAYAQGSTTKRLLVTLRSGSSMGTVMNKVRGARLHRTHFRNRILNLTLDTSSEEFMDLLLSSDVAAVEVPIIRHKNSDCIAPSAEVISTPLNLIGAPTLWSETQGQSVKVAVFDTGIFPTHNDLTSNIKGGINFVPPSGADAVDEVANPAAWTDDNGHGSHVAGIIGGAKNNSGIVGTAPKTSLYAVKVLDSEGYGSDSFIIDGLEWAIDNSMAVANLSLGAAGYSYALRTAVSEASDAGLIIVAAAGNEGDVNNGDLNEPSYPASFHQVVSVAAVTNSKDRAYFSNFNYMVDIAAPGYEILSSYNQSSTSFACASGTSQATPFVAGSFALLKSIFPSESASTLKKRLVCTAEDIDAFGRDDNTGYGLVRPDLAKAASSIPDCGYSDTMPEVMPTPAPTPDISTEYVYVQSFNGFATQQAGVSGLAVVGEVVNEDGTPVNGAEVTVSATSSTGYVFGSISVTTNSRGRAGVFLKDVSCGKVQFEVTSIHTTDGRGFRSDLGTSSFQFQF